MANSKMIVVRGEVNWAKVIGKARPYTGNPKFDKGPYWSVDITPDAKSREIITAAGIADKLREPKGEKETRTESYLSLKIQENKADGTKNDPPVVKKIDGSDWGEDLIGNGSVVDIQIKIVDYGTTVGAYFQKMRVLKHVEYAGGDFAPISSDDEFFATPVGGVQDVVFASGSQAGPVTAPKGAAKTAPNPDDLDDDVPFDEGN